MSASVDLPPGVRLASEDLPHAAAPDAGTQLAVKPNACVDGGELQPFSCPGLSPRATPEELCASPRPDFDAELLAIEASGAFVAPEPLYQQLSADLAAIRATVPAVQNVHHMPSFWPGMIVMFDPDAGVDVDTYDAWDCLNAYYGATTRYVYRVVLPGKAFDYAARMDTRQLAGDYGTLPGVRWPESNMLLGDSSDICVSLEGPERVYIFDVAGGDCPAGCTEHHYYGARVQQDGGLQTLGDWDPYDAGFPAPEWFATRTDCTKNL